MLNICPNLQSFLSPAMNSASQASAYSAIVRLFTQTSELHKLETACFVDRKLFPYLHVLPSSEATGQIVYAEARVFLLKTVVEEEQRAVTVAPTGESSIVRGENAGPAGQSAMRSLVELRNEPLIRNLELQLLNVWSAEEQLPFEVFRLALQMRSLTCIAILFGNLVGVKDAGAVYAILESASLDRRAYFSARLATPVLEFRRPDHTRWFTYAEKFDNAVRSPHFDTFAKMNLLELGAQLRQLIDQVPCPAELIPRVGQEFGPDSYIVHLGMLGAVGPWLQTLDFVTDGPAGFLTAFLTFSAFCQHGTLYRPHILQIHVGYMRQLYQAMLDDIHTSLHGFSSRRLLAYNQLLTVDAMFTQDKVFYGTHRLLMVEVAETNRLVRLGALPPPGPKHPAGAGSSQKRSLYVAGQPSSSGATGVPGKRLAASARPSYAQVGSFASSVQDSEEFLTIAGSKYAKTLILAKLGLTANDICLPSFLCKKGAAACISPGQAGHESHDSPMHVFSATATAARASFEQLPYRVATWAGPSSALVVAPLCFL